MWSLLDAAVGALLLFDADGRAVEWNHAAEEAFGWSRDEAVGADAAELLIPDELRSRWRAAVRAVATGDPTRPIAQRIELTARHRSGRDVPIELELSMVDGESQPLFAAFLHDISERKEAQARQRRFEAIVASSGEAIFSGSLEGTIESWNPACERLFGYRAAEVTGTSVTRLRTAGDLSGYAGEQRAVGAGNVVSFETHGRRKDGALVEVAVTKSPLRDEHGDVTGVVSILRDITERNETAANLAEANSRFAGAFEAASTGMAVLGPDGAFLEVNRALCLFLGRSADELLATSLRELTHPDDLAAGNEAIRRGLAGEIDSFQQSKRYLLPDGVTVWGLLTMTIVRDANATPQHFVAQIQDITSRKTTEGELRRYTAQLNTLSGQDPLTGLSNRRAFESALETQLSLLEAGGSPCSMLLVGVHGDDAAVSAAAESLTAASRDTDLVAYLGDGELAVLLPSSDTRTAAAIARRTRVALAGEGDLRFSHGCATPGVGVWDFMSSLRKSLPASQGSAVARRLALVPGGIVRLLELARGQLGMPVSFLSRVVGDDLVLAASVGDHGQMAMVQGEVLPLAQTLSEQTLDGRDGLNVTDLADVPAARGAELVRGPALTAYSGVPVRLSSGEIFGTLCCIDTRAHPELGERHVELLAFLAQLVAELVEDEGEQRAARDAEASATGVRTLLIALEARDHYTGEHSKKVVALASGVSRRLGLSDKATRDIEQVALLHDIGKVGIPDSILQKQGPLDEQEWELMRQHPIIGERIVAGTPGLASLAPAMRAEHERWDGDGYPDGLAGDRIPLASRITLACDALHAMTSDRPYRQAMTPPRAKQELRRCAGSQFDPSVITALIAEVESPAGPLSR
jgi:PAS domain S-box-containing protein